MHKQVSEYNTLLGCLIETSSSSKEGIRLREELKAWMYKTAGCIQPFPQARLYTGNPFYIQRTLNHFLIGCDPEFSIAHASNGQHAGSVHFDSMFGEMGSDHGGAVFEVRPKPDVSAYRVIRNIKHILLHPKMNILREANYNWLAGPMSARGQGSQPLGGHVHLDIPTFLELRSIVNALDNYNRLLEQLDILPRTVCERRRSETDYGHFGAYHEDHYRLEYRTFPSWLFHPEVGMICLTGAKILTMFPEKLETLSSYPSSFAFEHLKELFSEEGDTDTAKVRALLSKKGHKKLVHPPSTDLREVWGRLDF